MQEIPTINPQENPVLKLLNVSWNGFDDDGATAMGVAIGANSSLTELDLTCNRIGPKGMLNLLKGFKTNDTLEILRVSLQYITLWLNHSRLGLNKIYVCFLSHAQIQKLGSVGRLFCFCCCFCCLKGFCTTNC